MEAKMCDAQITAQAIAAAATDPPFYTCLNCMYWDVCNAAQCCVKKRGETAKPWPTAHPTQDEVYTRLSKEAAAKDEASLTPSQQRKATPLYSGVLAYFPLALAAVARLSKAGNDKHNPGQPLHWSRGKSNDHLDCIARHLADAGGFDEETGELHDVALAWRSLANLQIAEEKRLSREA